MARAYKCDKCGNFFLPFEAPFKGCYGVSLGMIPVDKDDLAIPKTFQVCPHCFADMQEMFKSALKEIE